MIRQHHLIRGTIALAAALTASLAPAAWADPAPLANAEARIGASQSSTAIQPNPDEQTTSNTPGVTGASCGDMCSGHGYSPVSVATRAPATPAPCGDVCSGHGYSPGNVSTRAIPSVRPPSAAAPSRGFDWGDAGIGAGSTLALTLIGVGGVLAVSNLRARRTHQGQASASR